MNCAENQLQLLSIFLSLTTHVFNIINNNLMLMIFRITWATCLSRRETEDILWKHFNENKTCISTHVGRVLYDVGSQTYLTFTVCLNVYTHRFPFHSVKCSWRHSFSFCFIF